MQLTRGCKVAKMCIFIFGEGPEFNRRQTDLAPCVVFNSLSDTKVFISGMTPAKPVILFAIYHIEIIDLTLIALQEVTQELHRDPLTSIQASYSQLITTRRRGNSFYSTDHFFLLFVFVLTVTSINMTTPHHTVSQMPLLI